MPNGEWDPAGTNFSGTLYRAHSPRHLGAPLGSAKLEFVDTQTAKLSYSIRGAQGTKVLKRLEFGPANGQAAPEAGVWDLLEAGSGGMTINKRGDQLFATWLRFASAGAGEWIVMPGGTWNAPDAFEGMLYRTSGSPWVATTYDRSRLEVAQIGRLSLRFTGRDSAEMTYTVDGVAGSGRLARHPF